MALLPSPSHLPFSPLPRRIRPSSFVSQPHFLLKPKFELHSERRSFVQRALAPSSAARGRGEELDGEEEKTTRKILFSDVAVKPKPRLKKWNSLDLATLGVVAAMHVLCVLAPFYFTWPAFWVAVSLYVIIGLFDITFSFHRNLSHRSFKLSKILEYLFAYCGALALQGNPVDWVSPHRFHHQFCDSDIDLLMVFGIAI